MKAPATLQRSSGECRISFADREGRTELAKSFQEGCAKVRFPKIRSDRRAEAVLINTSGGMTGGDRLVWKLKLQENTGAVVTTQACEKIYRCGDGIAEVAIEMQVAHGAHLSWLPQETILFDGSRLKRRLVADLSGNSSLLICEAVIFGRRGSGECVNDGLFRDRWDIRCEGRPVHIESTFLEGNLERLLAGAAVGDHCGAVATLLLAGQGWEEKLGEVRRLLADPCPGRAGVSAWPIEPHRATGKLLARILATDGYQLRRLLVPVLTLINGTAQLPKLWAI